MGVSGYDLADGDECPKKRSQVHGFCCVGPNRSLFLVVFLLGFNDRQLSNISRGFTALDLWFEGGDGQTDGFDGVWAFVTRNVL